MHAGCGCQCFGGAVLCVARAGGPGGRRLSWEAAAAAHRQGSSGSRVAAHSGVVLEVALQRARVGQLAEWDKGFQSFKAGRAVSAVGPSSRRGTGPCAVEPDRRPMQRRQAGRQAAGSRSRPRAGGRRRAWSWASAAGRAARARGGGRRARVRRGKLGWAANRACCRRCSWLPSQSRPQPASTAPARPAGRACSFRAGVCACPGRARRARRRRGRQTARRSGASCAGCLRVCPG